MTALGSTGIPYFKFDVVGKTVKGRILHLQDKQETVFNTNELAYWDEAKTQPKMGVLVTLETQPDNPQRPDASGVGEDSRTLVFIAGKRMKDAVVAAFRAEGASDLTVNSDMSITFTGKDGNAKCYVAKYAPYSPNA